MDWWIYSFVLNEAVKYERILFLSLGPYRNVECWLLESKDPWRVYDLLYRWVSISLHFFPTVHKKMVLWSLLEWMLSFGISVVIYHFKEFHSFIFIGKTEVSQPAIWERVFSNLILFLHFVCLMRYFFFFPFWHF